MKGLKRYRSGDGTYVYHRATGTRLPDLPETHPDFLRAYLAAEAAEPVKPNGGWKAGTLGALIAAYRISADHRTLSAGYQRLVEADAKKLAAKAGTVPLAQIMARHVKADLAALPPHAARQRRKTWRRLMAYAIAQGLLADDPSETTKAPAAPKANPHEPWTDAQIAAFRARWPIGTAQRTALELLHWTGARISDVCRMGEGMVDRDGWLCFRQQKTGGRVDIPLRRPAPDFADEADRAACLAAIEAARGHMTWLVTGRGAGRSQKSASQWFSAAARAAGITGRTAHGLRVTRAVKLAEAGASAHAIGAWTGHESLSEIEHYTRRFSRRALLEGTKPERSLSKTGKP